MIGDELSSNLRSERYSLGQLNSVVGTTMQIKLLEICAVNDMISHCLSGNLSGNLIKLCNTLATMHCSTGCDSSKPGITGVQ